MIRRSLAIALAAASALVSAAAPSSAATLTVGSKRFTESYILGEIVRTVAERAGEAVCVHRQGLGNTGIVFQALSAGSIDVYPEYTGTIARELLGEPSATDLDALNRLLAPRGLAVGIPLGFNDTYAIAMRSETAREKGIHSLSELRAHPEIRFGLSQEFVERQDGWPALVSTYQLAAAPPRALDHGLAYEALARGEVDATDVYSTDAKIERYRLTVLDDDRAAFPRYDAVLLYRKDLPERLPRTFAALERLAGRISERDMTRMNADAEIRGAPFASIASAFLDGGGAPRATSFTERLFAPDLPRLTVEHLFLVFASVALGTIVGVPLGLWAAYRAAAAPRILAVVGVLQTIPSLALLAFLIPIFHRIGTIPALTALFLYSLLPIVRGTHTGIREIAPSLRESALALGLPWSARLRLVDLPLASRSIVAGIRTSAVISVGTATIAAFIGAGGYGERIASGLALNDGSLLLAGAIPSAALALVVEWALGAVERLIVPKPLRSGFDVRVS